MRIWLEVHGLAPAGDHFTFHAVKKIWQYRDGMGAPRPRRRGRPPAGPAGQKVSQYPQLTIRLPAETKARLNTLSLLTGSPIWRIIDRAVDAYVRQLPEPDRSRLGEIAERLVQGNWPVTSHWQAMWPRATTRRRKTEGRTPAARPRTKSGG
jgi:predicted DNA-binding protein